MLSKPLRTRSALKIPSYREVIFDLIRHGVGYYYASSELPWTVPGPSRGGGEAQVGASG